MPVIAIDSLDKGYKIAFGEHTTVAASDTVASGLGTVVVVLASIESDPDDDLTTVTATNSTAGNMTIKTWKNAGATDGTPVAATTFSKKIHWIAVGY